MNSSVQTVNVALISIAFWTIIVYLLSTKEERNDTRLLVKESLLFIFPLAFTIAVLPKISGGMHWQMFLRIVISITILLIVLKFFAIKSLQKDVIYQKIPQLFKHVGHILIRFFASFALLYFFIMVLSFFV